MKDYKISDGEGTKEHEKQNETPAEVRCPVKKYAIKANGPVDYAIPDEAEFYRIQRDMETDAFCLEFYATNCKNCRKIPYVRGNSGKASKLEIRLKNRSSIAMDKKWKFD